MDHFGTVQARRPGSIPMQRIILFAIFSTRRQEEITRIRWMAQGHVGHPAGGFFGRHAELADAVRFAEFLAPLKNKRWFVYAKQPFAGPKAVLAYPPP